MSATTNERIEMPRDYLGRIGAATRLAALGVVASCALQVAPGFKGHLQFWLFNAGGGPVPLRPLDPVISLEFVRLAAVPDPATWRQKTKRSITYKRFQRSLLSFPQKKVCRP